MVSCQGQGYNASSGPELAGATIYIEAHDMSAYTLCWTTMSVILLLWYPGGGRFRSGTSIVTLTLTGDHFQSIFMSPLGSGELANASRVVRLGRQVAMTASTTRTALPTSSFQVLGALEALQ